MSATLEELVQRAAEARSALAECECDACLLKALAADLAVDRVRIEAMRSQVDALAAAFLKFTLAIAASGGKKNASQADEQQVGDATSNDCDCETCARVPR